MITMIADDLGSYGGSRSRRWGFHTYHLRFLRSAWRSAPTPLVFSLVDACLSSPFHIRGRYVLSAMGAHLHPHRRRQFRRGGSMALNGASWQAVTKVAGVDAALFSGLSSRVVSWRKSPTFTVSPERISAGYFRVLGVPPADWPRVHCRRRCRWRARARGVEPPTLLALGVRLATPSVVGQSILLKGEPHGRRARCRRRSETTRKPDPWTPIRPSTRARVPGSNYGVVVRLKDGVTWAQAAAEAGAAADSR